MGPVAPVESIPYLWTIDPESLALLIRRRGFTPYSLAQEAGVHKAMLYRFINGRRSFATYPTANAIAHALNLDVTLFADPIVRSE